MKNFLLILLGIIVGSAAVFVFWFYSPKTESVAQLTGPIQYNCELSGGTFENGVCVCPIEEQLGQTQEMMYDEKSGFCQTTFGGAGGNAFAAGQGLPWGRNSYYNDVINYWCDESGGSKSGAACICPTEKTYDKKTGKCQ